MDNLFSRLVKALEKKPVFSTFITTPYITQSMDLRKLYYGIVFSCVDAIASNVSNVEYGLFTYDKNGDKKQVENNEAYNLLERPNDFMTGADLLYIISSHIDSHGVAYLYLVRSGNTKVQEIWPLDPSRMKVVKDETFISGYVYINPKGVKVPFEIADIIPIKRPNPFDMYSGVSTIEMARHAQENDYYSLSWNKGFFANGAVPSGILTTDNTIPQEKFETVKREWKKQYAGVENAHKTAVLQMGFKYSQISPKQKDMDFLEQRKFNRDEILSIFKVPKSVVAISDDVNRASAETSEYVFAKRVLQPRLNLIFEKLNRFYLPLFAGGEKLRFEYESPVPENLDYQLTRKSTAVNKWLTINEVRAEDGYEPIEGGDYLYGTAGQTPIGQDVVITPPEDDSKFLDIPKEKALKLAKVDRELLIKRNKYLYEMEKQYALKFKQHYRQLITKIKRGKKLMKELTINKKDGIEAIFTRIFPNLTDWKHLLLKINIEFTGDVLKQSIKDTGEIYEIPNEFSLEHSGAIAWINNEAKNATETTVNTIIEEAKRVIGDEMEQDDFSLANVMDALASKMGDLEDYKAERIARTELIDAYSEGSLLEYKASGVVDKVKWLNADSTACKICQANEDDGAIDLNTGDVFTSGDDAPTAHPNCRCTLIPVFD